MFSPLERGLNFQQMSYNTSHPTPSVCRYTILQKLEVQILANLEENANQNVCADF